MIVALLGDPAAVAPSCRRHRGVCHGATPGSIHRLLWPTPTRSARRSAGRRCRRELCKIQMALAEIRRIRPCPRNRPRRHRACGAPAPRARIAARVFRPLAYRELVLPMSRKTDLTFDEDRRSEEHPFEHSSRCVPGDRQPGAGGGFRMGDLTTDVIDRVRSPREAAVEIVVVIAG